MRKIFALALLAACGDPALKVYPDAPPPVPYNLTWTRESGARPDVASTTTLAIDGLTLTYGGGPGGEAHVATGDDGTCLGVPGQAGRQGVQPYQICKDGTGYSATIAWLAIGGAPPSGTWHVQAWR